MVVVDTMADNKELQCLINQRVGVKFVIGPYVSGGSFGCVFLGHDTKNNQKVAIKLEKQDMDKPQLHLEYGFYRSLGNMRFLPKISYFGFCLNWNALVMELLGPSLSKMCSNVGGQFSIVTTTKILIQMLNIFEYVHDFGIIYRDIKPDNFLFGQPDSPKWSMVHLIDMGFCKRYLDDNNRHIKFKEGKCMTGTVRYISINNHMCRELSRRDDLEAIMYMMIFLHKGELPWQGIAASNIREKYRLIGLKKMAVTSQELCHNMPREYTTLLDTVRNLDFEARPRYKSLINTFRCLLWRMGVNFEDSNYDWDISHKPVPENRRL